MKKPYQNGFLYLAALPIFAIAVFFSQMVGQADFLLILTCFIAFFAFYALVCYSVKTEKAILFFIGVAIITRFLLIFALPNLSDDFYRFIWDGRLINNGVNPYLYLPSELMKSKSFLLPPDQGQSIFPFLNSSAYYSVYPPVNQIVFTIATWFSPEKITGAVAVMKGVFLLAEIGTIWLIVELCRQFRLPGKAVLLYALNPLIILEAFNNLHFEIVMIFFLALALWGLTKERWWISAIAMGFAVGTKLLPLMFLPFLIKALGWKKSTRFFLVAGVVILALFSPVLNAAFIDNFGTSLELYFRKFEFNASVYYVMRWFGIQLSGYNMIGVIGPFLGLVTVMFIFWRAFRRQIGNLYQLPLNWMLAMTVFLLCSTTVHPWYLSSIIFLCVFTPYRYPLVWSGLILLTYINYSFDNYMEVLWIVALEYVVLALFMWYEWKVPRIAVYRNEQFEV